MMRFAGIAKLRHNAFGACSRSTWVQWGAATPQQSCTDSVLAESACPTKIPSSTTRSHSTEAALLEAQGPLVGVKVLVSLPLSRSTSALGLAPNPPARKKDAVHT